MLIGQGIEKTRVEKTLGSWVRTCKSSQERHLVATFCGIRDQSFVCLVLGPLTILVRFRVEIQMPHTPPTTATTPHHKDTHTNTKPRAWLVKLVSQGLPDN
jgi:hypothetical protein